MYLPPVLRREERREGERERKKEKILWFKF